MSSNNLGHETMNKLKEELWFNLHALSSVLFVKMLIIKTPVFPVKGSFFFRELALNLLIYMKLNEDTRPAGASC